MQIKILPSWEVLDRYFEYNDKTGDLIRKVTTSSNAKKGDVIKNVSPKGYKRVRFEGEDYYAHRVIWKLFYKEEPPEIIDHINLDKLDNRISNLREICAFGSQQNQGIPVNNTTGFKGVYQPDHLKGKYRSMITANGRTCSLGVFDNFQDARNARSEAERKYHVV
jgi:hypothetical protein